MEAFLVLYGRGASLSDKDINGCGLMHWAAYKNQKNMLIILKALQLDCNSIDRCKYTPICRAACNNSLDAIDFLYSLSDY
jgi:hypothetical protein